MRSVKTVRCTFDIKCNCGEGFIEPKDQLEVKTVGDWTPMRHGVLMDSYWKYIREGGRSTQEFCRLFDQEVSSGKHPIMLKNKYDMKPDVKFTAKSYEAQIGWLKQKENQVVFYTEDGENGCYSSEQDICFNNILAVTSVQKSKEAERGREMKKALMENQECSSVDSEEIVDVINVLSKLTPEQVSKLTSILSKV